MKAREICEAGKEALRSGKYQQVGGGGGGTALSVSIGWGSAVEGGGARGSLQGGRQRRAAGASTSTRVNSHSLHDPIPAVCATWRCPTADANVLPSVPSLQVLQVRLNFANPGKWERAGTYWRG